MPIVFVHGVATRDIDDQYRSWVERIKSYLRYYVAPVVAKDAARVRILDAYWGDLGVSFAWHQHSRPPSALTGMGADKRPSDASQVIALGTAPGAVKGVSGVAGGGAAGRGILTPAPQDNAAKAAETPFRLADLEPEALADLLVTLLQQGDTKPPHRYALAAIAADQVARDPATRVHLRELPDRAAEINYLKERVARRATELELAEGGVVAQGGPGLGARSGRSACRSREPHGKRAGVGAHPRLSEFRGPANARVTLFIGDVFRYLSGRGTAANPGPIPKAVIDTLKQARAGIPRNEEPMVVVTHSMGGQILYDVVTSFLPKDPAGHDLRVDFWCATASQVGLFEEMKQFLNSQARYGADMPEKLVPHPNRHYLGHWWNVWDENDFISYTAKGIFAEVDDSSYDSGMSLFHAHGGYLERPSFYRMLAAKIAAAGQNGWRD